MTTQEFEPPALQRPDGMRASAIERLADLVYVPGLWRCPKCQFELLRANLNAGGGSVTARDQPGDKCPNCATALWRVTEREAGNRLCDRIEAMAAELAEAKATIKRLGMTLEAERTQIAARLIEARKSVESREWLRDGRGPFAWDDDDYRREFARAAEEFLLALRPLKKIAADLTDCPRTLAAANEARALLKGADQ